MDYINLIDGKLPESDWLDYKQEWHTNTAKLIADILAFVNTTHQRTCYMIFGIADDLSVIGLENDENRKNTEQIISIFQELKLSSSIPVLTVHEIDYWDKTVDVLEIGNSRDVPLYLVEKYTRGSRGGGKDSVVNIGPGQIFCRIGNRNTPLNKSANTFQVEALMRKKFGLDLNVQQRFKLLLEKPQEWSLVENETKYIYNFDPNYWFCFRDLPIGERLVTGDFFPWLLKASIFDSEKKVSSYQQAVLHYGNHCILESGLFHHFDRDRGWLPAPKRMWKSWPQGKVSYLYYVNSSLEMKIYKFISKYHEINHGYEYLEDKYSNGSIISEIPIFENQSDVEGLLEIEKTCGGSAKYSLDDLSDEMKSMGFTGESIDVMNSTYLIKNRYSK